MSCTRHLATILALAAMLSACGDDAGTPPEPARTVTVATVRDELPNPPLSLTGVAEPYREADVGFEVSGRLIALIDVGRNVEVVTQRDASGKLVSQGEIIAQIDGTTFQQRLEAAKLRLASAQAGIKATTVDLEEVAPATIARAKAQLEGSRAEVAAARATVQSAESSEKTAEADLGRARKLLADRQIPRAEFDQSQNKYDTSVANTAKAKAGLLATERQVVGFEAAVAEAEASLHLKAENLARAQAEIKELELAVQQAQTDVDRCTLRAPFAGRVTFIHVSQGDFVQAGAPVLSLTLIDPIKISVTVSAERERKIRPGEHAFVFPAGLESFATGEAFLTGTVFEKGSIADPATRTFRIDIMVRNARRRLLEKLDKDTTLINFRQMLPAVERNFGEGGPLFVCDSCIATGNLVYRVKGMRFGRPRDASFFKDDLEIERIAIQPSGTGPDDYMQILNWTFRRMASPGELRGGDLLLNFTGDLTPESIASGPIRLDRYEWAIRPGDLIPVRFEIGSLPKGLYVPDDAIVSRNANQFVYVVEGDRAREVPVKLGISSGQYRQIHGEGLQAGSRVVLRGVHYCFDGAKLVVTAESDA